MNKDFLENYNLYQKYKIEIPADTREFEINFGKASIHMDCEVCNSEQTFIMTNGYAPHYDSIVSAYGKILHLNYECAGCGVFQRVFSIKVSDKLDYLMKTGQYPNPDISIDKSISKALGEHEELFKKGLICESQSYGIAAYAYYRRIVEKVIDELLDDITDLVDASDKIQYEEALKKTKETSFAKDKIELVKDLLPTSLKPNGMNPLGSLYGILSEGMHAKSDDECIEIAGHIKTILVFFIKQVIQSKQESKEFTASMKKILEKKSK